MITKIPIRYDRLDKATQTSNFIHNGRVYQITIRKSIMNGSCYATFVINGVTIFENRVCTVREWLLDSMVDRDVYPENIQFAYVTRDYNKNFDFDELGETLFLFFWDGDRGDFK